MTALAWAVLVAFAIAAALCCLDTTPRAERRG